MRLKFGADCLDCLPPLHVFLVPKQATAQDDFAFGFASVYKDGVRVVHESDGGGAVSESSLGQRMNLTPCIILSHPAVFERGQQEMFYHRPRDRRWRLLVT